MSSFDEAVIWASARKVRRIARKVWINESGVQRVACGGGFTPYHEVPLWPRGLVVDGPYDGLVVEPYMSAFTRNSGCIVGWKPSDADKEAQDWFTIAEFLGGP